MSFADGLDKFSEKTMRKFTKLKRLSAFDLFSAIVLETPVDKGVLRNNWFAGIGNPSSKTTKNGAPVGTATITRIQAELKGTNLVDDIFFTNSLPYAIPIEFDGLSGKAPQGMVRVNTIRWEQIVSTNTRKAQRGV